MPKGTQNSEQLKTVNDQPVQNLINQVGEKRSGKKELIHGLLALLTAVFIVVLIIGGFFWFSISKNIGGLSEKYRHQIQSIPIFKLALPKPPDPEDPKYMTSDELKQKYMELRQKRDDLTSQLAEANKTIEGLKKYKDNQATAIADNEKAKKDIEAKKKQLDDQRKSLDADTKKLNKLIASGDKSGFKAYFEQVDKDTAQKIYTQIIKEQKASDDASKFAKLYDGMDPEAAAKIFEQMGTGKMDLIVKIFTNINQDNVTQILQAMTPDFSSKITEKLSQIYLKK
jgi:flagellar motility protein MotE (MotC chaperone)